MLTHRLTHSIFAPMVDNREETWCLAKDRLIAPFPQGRMWVYTWVSTVIIGHETPAPTTIGGDDGAQPE